MRIASHFDAAGRADGFMPRDEYLRVTLALVVALPMFIGALGSIVRVIPVTFVNLPHRNYWLAPARRAETIAFLQWHGAFMGVMLAAFLAFVHGLVVRANHHTPPVLSGTAMWVGTGVFLFLVAVWIVVLVRHFRWAKSTA